MSYSFQQIAHGPEDGAVNNSSIQATFSNPQTTGNLIISIVEWEGAANFFVKVSDTSLNVYHQALAPTFSGTSTLNSGTGGSMTIYYAYNIASATAGSNVVTALFTGNTGVGDFSNNIVCWEVSYGSSITTDPFSGSAGFTTGTNTGTVNGPVLSVASGGFVVCGGVSDNVVTHGLNYTQEHQGAWSGDQYEDRYNLTGPSETPTVVVIVPWMAAAASFNPPSGISRLLPTDAVFFGMT